MGTARTGCALVDIVIAASHLDCWLEHHTVVFAVSRPFHTLFHLSFKANASCTRRSYSITNVLSIDSVAYLDY